MFAQFERHVVCLICQKDNHWAFQPTDSNAQQSNKQRKPQITPAIQGQVPTQQNQISNRGQRIEDERELSYQLGTITFDSITAYAIKPESLSINEQPPCNRQNWLQEFEETCCSPVCTAESSSESHKPRVLLSRSP